MNTDEYDTIADTIIATAEADTTLDAISVAIVRMRAREWAQTARAVARVGSSAVASYTIAGRSVTRANLGELTQRADELWTQLGALVSLPTQTLSAPTWLGVDFRTGALS